MSLRLDNNNNDDDSLTDPLLLSAHTTVSDGVPTLASDLPSGDEQEEENHDPTRGVINPDRRVPPLPQNVEYPSRRLRTSTAAYVQEVFDHDDNDEAWRRRMGQSDLEQDFQSHTSMSHSNRTVRSQRVRDVHTSPSHDDDEAEEESASCGHCRSILGMVVTVLVVLLLVGLALVAYFVGWIMAAQVFVFCMVSGALSPLLTALYILSQKQKQQRRRPSQETEEEAC